ncbi:MAG: LysR substrate-binding domain-containing protein [Gammaproteobacteria bacterium]|nr:LysR substrate-binding domain-containing protein [Gammaproteobacteria bacterium]
MESLRKRLPPTRALVAFEATARHLSFTRAAGELHLTQAAVSRQIRLLEQDLGVLLFNRDKRAVSLTPEGQRLRRTVAMALGHIAETAVALRRIHKVPHINLHTTTAFGALWLMRRIGRFRSAFPEIQLRLVTSDDEIDLFSGNVDVSISYGESEGDWPGADAVRLLEDELFPVCSPEFKRGLPDDFDIHDLPAHPLLHLESAEPTWMSWSTWFRNMDVDAADHAAPGTRFNNYLVILQAVQTGQGIALGWRRLVQPLLDTGQLVRPVADSLEAGSAYYLLVQPGSLMLRPELRIVHDWLVQEAALEDQAPAAFVTDN